MHTTFQYAGTEGKRHRLREAKLFCDQPEYYDSPGKFGLLFDLGKIWFTHLRKLEVCLHRLILFWFLSLCIPDKQYPSCNVTIMANVTLWH